MFYERTDMQEMYEIASSKDNWNFLLLTSEVHLEGVLGNTEFDNMLREWVLSIRNCMDKSDAAYRINQGNVFILMKDERMEEFLDNIEKKTTVARVNKAIVSSSVLHLTKKDSEFLLQMSTS